MYVRSIVILELLGGRGGICVVLCSIFYFCYLFHFVDFSSPSPSSSSLSFVLLSRVVLALTCVVCVLCVFFLLRFVLCCSILPCPVMFCLSSPSVVLCARACVFFCVCVLSLPLLLVRFFVFGLARARVFLGSTTCVYLRCSALHCSALSRFSSRSCWRSSGSGGSSSATSDCCTTP